jgi:hypothetical protein
VKISHTPSVYWATPQGVVFLSFADVASRQVAQRRLSEVNIAVLLHEMRKMFPILKTHQRIAQCAHAAAKEQDWEGVLGAIRTYVLNDGTYTADENTIESVVQALSKKPFDLNNILGAYTHAKKS